jgi:hypothetical protein
MNREKIALFIPPAAVMKHGCATCTAGPIGVFWVTSLVAIVYGLMGGTLGGIEASRWVVIGLGIVMWIIAAVWARLVMRGVHEDLTDHHESSVKRRVVPHSEEMDPMEHVRGSH